MTVFGRSWGPGAPGVGGRPTVRGTRERLLPDSKTNSAASVFCSCRSVVCVTGRSGIYLFALGAGSGASQIWPMRAGTGPPGPGKPCIFTGSFDLLVPGLAGRGGGPLRPRVQATALKSGFEITLPTNRRHRGGQISRTIYKVTFRIRVVRRSKIEPRGRNYGFDYIIRLPRINTQQ